MNFSKLIEFFTRKPTFFIYVQDGKIGMETYFNPKCKDLSPPHKAQIKAFLNQIIDDLE